MTTVTLEQLKEHIQHNLPYWYNDQIHNEVLALLIQSKKLQACKHLVDTSKLYATNSEYGLYWAKNQLCDFIERLSQRLESNAKFEYEAHETILREYTFDSVLVDKVANLMQEYNSIAELRHMLKYVPTNVLEDYLNKNKDF